MHTRYFPTYSAEDTDLARLATQGNPRFHYMVHYMAIMVSSLVRRQSLSCAPLKK